MEPRVMEADYVINALSNVSHSQTTMAIELAKKHNKSHANFDQFGPISFIRAVNEAIDKERRLSSVSVKS